jgi:hypothetical protein
MLFAGFQGGLTVFIEVGLSGKIVQILCPTSRMEISRVLTVKILALHYPERYFVRRAVMAAQREFMLKDPHLTMEVIEVSAPGEIGKYAFVLVLPTLVINEKVVCSGRVPNRVEVLDWLLAAVGQEKSSTSLP